MRVLLVGNNYFALHADRDKGLIALGGLESFILNYAECMLERGHSIAIAATDDSTFSLFEDKYGDRFQFIPLGGPSRSLNNDRFSYKNYERFCESLTNKEYGDFDFVLNNNTASSVVIRGLLNECLTHGTIILTVMHRESTRMGSYIIGAQIAEAIKKSNGRYMLVANSEFTRNNWKQFTDSAVVNLGTKPYPGKVTPRSSNFGKGLFIGRVSPEKAPHVPIMAAINRYKPKEPQLWEDLNMVPLIDADVMQVEELIPLELIGNTTRAPKIVADYCDGWEVFYNSVDDKVKWHGHMPYDQHIKLQAEENVYLVHSTIMLESFGLITAEGMSVGVPSVLRDKGNLPYFVNKGEVIEENRYFKATTTGVLVYSGRRGDMEYVQGFRKAMQWLSQNMDKYPRDFLIQHHAEHYSMDVMLDNYIALVADIDAGKVVIDDRTRRVKMTPKGEEAYYAEIPYPQVFWERNAAITEGSSPVINESV